LGFLDSIRKLFSPPEGEDRASLSKRVQASPQEPQARQKLGSFLLRQGEVVEGLDQLARAAIMYEKDGFAGKAVAILRHMLKHDPSNVEFLRWLIRLLGQEGLTGDALRELENVVGRQGLFTSDEQKLEFLRNASESLPQSPLPSLYIADLFRSQRKFQEAINELDKAARKVQGVGQVNEFAERLSGVMLAAVDDMEVLEACGFLWLRVGKTTEAVSLLSDVIEKTRKEEGSGDTEGMERVLDDIRDGRSVAGALSFRDAARRMAEAAKLPAPPEPAEPAPEPVTGPEPEGPPTAAPLMEDDYRDEESIVQDALSRLQAKVTEEIGDSDPEARYNLGIAYKEMGLLDEAVGEFLLALKKPELFVGASSLLADTLAARGKFPEALEALEEVLSSGSLTEAERRDLRYHKADLLNRWGKQEEANGLFLEIFGEAPGYRDVASRTERLRR
jgi:tetratricopeptide (TPR) repeat protein